MKDKLAPGQLIMAGIPGSELDRETLNLIRRCGIGNFIIFGRNTANGPEGLAALISGIKRACAESGLPQPLIAVDQEGGRVQRLGPPHWPALPALSDIGNTSLPAGAARQHALDTAGILETVGINVNLAPVLDLQPEGDGGVLAGRTFSADPGRVSELGCVYVRTLQEKGIIATAKHFPGIGAVNDDPHHHRPVVPDDPGLMDRALEPFTAAIDCGVSAVMTSHVIFPSIDPWQPATFSAPICTGLLRDKLGFQGILFSDDMEMGGITRHNRTGEAALKAVRAGHDIILVCHSLERIRKAWEALSYGLEKGLITPGRLEKSLERIARAKSCINSERKPE